MTYDYKCESCEKTWEENLTIATRNAPCEKPCPHCGSEKCVIKLVSPTRMSYDGAVSNIRRAGSGWNDMLKTIKKNAGRQSTIEHY